MKSLSCWWKSQVLCVLWVAELTEINQCDQFSCKKLKFWTHSTLVHETTLWNIENELIYKVYFRYKGYIIFYGTYSRNCKKQSWTTYLCNHVCMYLCFCVCTTHCTTFILWLYCNLGMLQNGRGRRKNPAWRCLKFWRLSTQFQKRFPLKFLLVEGLLLVGSVGNGLRHQTEIDIIKTDFGWTYWQKKDFWIRIRMYEKWKHVLTSNAHMKSYLWIFDERKDLITRSYTRIDLILDCFQKDNSSPNLVRLTRIMLCLSHKQTAVEREFSINKELNRGK